MVRIVIYGTDCQKPSGVISYLHHVNFRSELVLVSVDYRLAPETVFPGGLEDCERALNHFMNHSAFFGVDPSKVVLMGDSAGGTLVAATHYLAERGAKDVTAINIIAAPEGIKYVEEHIDPSIGFKVVVCAVDERLNDKCYIVPGLGDAGDRLYGVID